MIITKAFVYIYIYVQLYIPTHENWNRKPREIKKLSLLPLINQLFGFNASNYVKGVHVNLQIQRMYTKQIDRCGRGYTYNCR